MENVIVIGFGSIGKRHADVLSKLGCSVACVTRQMDCALPVYDSVDQAIAEHRPSIVIVANETVKHRQSILELAEVGYDQTLLVEKPISEKFFTPIHALTNTFVAYNLRFHPALLSMRNKLSDQKTIMVSIVAGQHLSEWRPGRRVDQSYSASRSQGGGVLRDLSHELDYIMWLFGDVARVSALGGNRDVLGIDADELWAVLLEMKSGAIVNLSLSYLDVPACREMKVITSENTMVANLITGELTVDDQTEEFVINRDFTYMAMHQAILKNETSLICSLAEGLKVVSLIEAIEKAESTQSWQSL